MICKRDVTHNIVVNEGIPLRSVVPWFLLWIARSTLQSRKLIFEIEHVVGLLISLSCIFVFGNGVDVAVILVLPPLFLNVLISKNLSYRIVFCLLSFNYSTGNLHIWVGFALKLLLGGFIRVNISLPALILIFLGEEYFIR